MRAVAPVCAVSGAAGAGGTDSADDAGNSSDAFETAGGAETMRSGDGIGRIGSRSVDAQPVTAGGCRVLVWPGSGSGSDRRR